MGGIHCMYTSANKPFISVFFFWYITLRQPFFCPLLVVLWTWSCIQSARESAENTAQWTDIPGWLLFIWKDDPTVEKGKKGKTKQKQTHPATINQSLRPMLSTRSAVRRGSFQYQLAPEQIYNIGGHDCSKKRGISHPTGLLWVEK